MSKPAKPAAAAAGDQPPKSKKMLIIIIALVVLLAGGGAAAYFLLMKPHPPKTEQAAETEAASEHGAPGEAPKMFDLVGEAKPLVVNLVAEEGDRYLSVEISLQLSDPTLEEKIKANDKLVMDAVNTILAKKRPSDFQGDGWKQIKIELRDQINYELGFTKTPPVHHAAPEHAAEGTPEPAHAAPVEDHVPTRGVTRVVIPHYLVQ